MIKSEKDACRSSMSRILENTNARVLICGQTNGPLQRSIINEKVCDQKAT